MKAIVAGGAVYFVIYGLRATGFFSSVPVAHAWLMNLSEHDIVLVSTFTGILYFAFTFFNRMTARLSAMAAVMLLFSFDHGMFSQIGDTLRSLVQQISSWLPF